MEDYNTNINESTNLGSGLEQAHTCGVVKPVNWIIPLHPPILSKSRKSNKTIYIHLYLFIWKLLQQNPT